MARVPPEASFEWIPRTRRRFREEDVPLTPHLGVLGRKWSLVILRRVAAARRTSFAQLLRVDRRLSRRILSMRLRELQRFGYLVKSPTAEGPYRHEYRLTGKGRYAVPLLLAFSDLVRRYGSDPPAAPPAVDPAPRATAVPAPDLLGWPVPPFPVWEPTGRSTGPGVRLPSNARNPEDEGSSLREADR